MKTSYMGIFKMQFKGELQYRGKAISGIITQFFWGILYVYLFTAFMRGGVEGFTISQMATYIWLGQSFFVLRYVQSRPSVNMEIANGDVCYRFIKPLDIYNQWFAEITGEKLAKTLLRCFPIIIITFCLPENVGLSLPVSVWAFLLFLVTLTLGMFMAVTISMFAYHLTFATMCPKGSSGIINAVVSLFNGSLIPTPLMPSVMQNIIKWLPFGVISDLPFRIYCGNIGLQEGLFRFGIGLVWLAILIFLGKILLNKSLKNVVVQGG